MWAPWAVSGGLDPNRLLQAPQLPRNSEVTGVVVQPRLSQQTWGAGTSHGRQHREMSNSRTPRTTALVPNPPRPGAESGPHEEAPGQLKKLKTKQRHPPFPQAPPPNPALNAQIILSSSCSETDQIIARQERGQAAPLSTHLTFCSPPGFRADSFWIKCANGTRPRGGLTPCRPEAPGLCACVHVCVLTRVCA